MSFKIFYDRNKHLFSNIIVLVIYTHPDQLVKDLKHLIRCNVFTFFRVQEKCCLDRSNFGISVSPLEVIIKYAISNKSAHDISKLLSKSKARKSLNSFYFVDLCFQKFLRLFCLQSVNKYFKLRIDVS